MPDLHERSWKIQTFIVIYPCSDFCVWLGKFWYIQQFEIITRSYARKSMRRYAWWISYWSLRHWPSYQTRSKTTAGRYPTKKIGLPLGKGFISRWHGRGFAGRGGKICTVSKILVFTCWRLFMQVIRLLELLVFPIQCSKLIYWRNKSFRPVLIINGRKGWDIEQDLES